MKDIYIYHHLGLGDHIILNGLVRFVAESYNKTFVFTKPNNIKNVIRMYSDNKNIIIISLDNEGTRNFIKIFPFYKYFIVGHTTDFFKRVDDPNIEKTFDQLFYEDSNIPFNYKWEKFYLQRDLEREKEVYYDILKMNDKSQFIFCHEGNYKPFERKIPNDIQIIRPNNIDISLFDYLYTIEKAKEVHVTNSSFMNLIDCIQLRQDNLFYHEYSRPGINTVLKLPWKILK